MPDFTVTVLDGNADTLVQGVTVSLGAGLDAATDSNGAATFSLSSIPNEVPFSLTVGSATVNFRHDARSHGPSAYVGIQWPRGNDPFHWTRINAKSAADNSAVSGVTGYVIPEADNQFGFAGNANGYTFSGNASGHVYLRATRPGRVMAFITARGMCPAFAPLAIGATAATDLKMPVAPLSDGSGLAPVYVQVTKRTAESRQELRLEDNDIAIGWLTDSSDTIKAGPVILSPESRTTLSGVFYTAPSTAYRFYATSPTLRIPIGSAYENVTSNDGTVNQFKRLSVAACPTQITSVGLRTVTIRVNEAGTTSRITQKGARQAQAWLTSDAKGIVTTGLFASVDGPSESDLVFYDVPAGTYYAWVAADGYMPVMSQTVTVAGSNVSATYSAHKHIAMTEELAEVADPRFPVVEAGNDFSLAVKDLATANYLLARAGANIQNSHNELYKDAELPVVLVARPDGNRSTQVINPSSRRTLCGPLMPTPGGELCVVYHDGGALVRPTVYIVASNRNIPTRDPNPR